MPPLSQNKRPATPWNKGKIVGQKPPLKIPEIWEIRIRLKLTNKIRDLALFNLALDSKLRGCDLVKLKVRDVSHANKIRKRAMVMQQKTMRPVQFEITKETRDSIFALIQLYNLTSNDYLFQSLIKSSPHISTRQYARILKSWANAISKNPYDYGTHSLLRTKVSLIYRQTKNIRAIQLQRKHPVITSCFRASSCAATIH
ncbi:tyrosine-type recombinase/integrase [Vibrio sp.]|uniref:tyrosine-type recombinase/integrase n=1 Tax=Vibrio sp. TaxID=678 RepID=UPI003D114D61